MRNNAAYLAACAAMGAAFAASPLAAAELSHRWSFNGDYSDSAGGADAVKRGTYVSLYGGARAFDYEIRVEAMEVDRKKIWMTKRVYSPHYYWAAERDSETVTCLFAVSELPPHNGKLDPQRGTVYRFAVSPANSFGAHGRAICSEKQI